MGVGGDALARQPLSPEAPEVEATRRLALVQPRPVRRTRPVAILKIPRFWTVGQAGPAAAPAEAMGVNLSAPAEGLDAFGSEAAPLPGTRVVVARVPAPPVPVSVPAAGHVHPGTNRAPVIATWAKWLAVILLSSTAAVAGVFGYQRWFRPVVTTGTVTIETTPAGLDVVIPGIPPGKTPLTTTLVPGTYDIQVGSAESAKRITIVVAAGTSTVQRVEFAREVLGTSGLAGGLRVQTEPAHLPVLVDGTAHGVAPVLIDNLPSGEHEVSVRTASGVIRRTVTVQPRETLSLIVSSAAPAGGAPAVSAGWMTVSAAIPLQLRENGKVIGTSESDRLMLPAGDHEIEFANPSLGFTTRKTVRVSAGKTAAARIDLPNGVVSVNAQPWAEVWIDGERVGETPIGNLARPIGNHEILFRHPEFGERRETVVIEVGRPARIGVDLRK
jgi:hypothetical protein